MVSFSPPLFCWEVSKYTFLMKIYLSLIHNSLHLGSTYICQGTFHALIKLLKACELGTFIYYSGFIGNKSTKWLSHVPKITYLASSKTKIQMQVLAPEAFSIPAVLTVVWPGDLWGLRDPCRGSMNSKLFHNKTKMLLHFILILTEEFSGEYMMGDEIITLYGYLCILVF